jgi:hypothetical protein
MMHPIYVSVEMDKIIRAGRHMKVAVCDLISRQRKFSEEMEGI